MKYKIKIQHRNGREITLVKKEITRGVMAHEEYLTAPDDAVFVNLFGPVMAERILQREFNKIAQQAHKQACHIESESMRCHFIRDFINDAL